MNKHHKKKNNSRIIKFWNWLGKQNVFLVFAVFFLMIYGSTKVFGYFFSDQNYKSENPKSTIKTTVTFTPTPTPAVVKYPVSKTIERMDSTNSAKLTSTSTIDQDPIVDCKRPDDCGGGTVRIKQSKCLNAVCCPVDNNNFEVMTYDECSKKQVEFLKKQNEEYQKYLDAYNKNIEENQDQYNKELTDYKNQLLEQCRENARDTYKQKPIGSTTNSNTGGYVVGESQTIREQLNKALQTCNNLYGQ